VAAGQSGSGTIKYYFEMPGGETFYVEKTFWVGEPDPDYIDFINIGPNYPGSMLLCEDMPNDGKVAWNATGSILEYSWSVFDDGGTYWQVNQHPMDPFPQTPMQDVQFSTPYGSVNGNVNVKVKARNTCGWGEFSSPSLQFSTTSCNGYYLMFTPNPTTGETTLTIGNSSPENVTHHTASVEDNFDENAVWELEVFDQTHMLKEKNTKLKGKTYKLNTSGWKEGIYSIRVKYKDEVLDGRLLVRK